MLFVVSIVVEFLLAAIVYCITKRSRTRRQAGVRPTGTGRYNRPTVLRFKLPIITQYTAMINDTL